jgi:multisubunit Na+/H+ antiporter MnhC subunit
MFDFSQYALNKILLAIGALAGVSIMNVMWQPKFIRHKGIIAAAMISTAIAITLALTAGGAILIWLGVDQTKADMVLFVGVSIGALAPFTLNALRNFFEKYEDKDILELKDAVKGDKK